MRKPRGHIRRHGTGYQVIVPVGTDPITKRYEYAYGQAPTLKEAEELRDCLLDEVAAGRQPKDKKTKFGELLDDMLELADIEFTTRGMYQGYIERTIRPALGDYEIGFLEKHPELLDRLYARLRRCRKLCGGRRGLVGQRENHQRPNKHSAHASGGHDIPAAINSPGHRQGHDLSPGLETQATRVLTRRRPPSSKSAVQQTRQPLLGAFHRSGRPGRRRKNRMACRWGALRQAIRGSGDLVSASRG